MEVTDDLNLECISLKNAGDVLVDLSGWTLSDEGNATFTFPEGFVLPAGGLVTVHTGCGEDSAEALHWRSEKPIWDDTSDRATLRTQDETLVATHAYARGCSTCGK